MPEDLRTWVETNFKTAGARGDEVDVHCPFHDDRHASASVNVAIAAFHCMTCGDSVPGKLSEVARLKGWTAPPYAGSDTRQKVEEKKVSEFIVPVPGDLETPLLAAPRESWTSRYGSWSASWEYRDSAGRLTFIVARFDKPDSQKNLVPFAIGSDRKPRTGNPFPKGQRPLYGLDRMAAEPDLPVLIVEGEKCASVQVPGHVSMTWPGGASAVDAVDWTPLKSRKVIVWPDADEAGQRAALDIRGHLPNAAILKTPDDTPAKFDIFDYFAGGGDPVRWIEENMPDPGESEIAPIRIVSAETERTAEIPPRRWFLDKMITVGFCLVSAKKGIGKSFFIMQASQGMASGQPFLGRKTENVKVLLGVFELDRTAIHERLQRFEETSKNLFITYSWPSGDAAIEAIEYAAAEGFEVIVLDMFSAILPPGMETNSYEMTPFLLKVRRTAHRLGIAIIGLWHNAKADREDPMLAALGTTGLSGQSDCVLVLDRKRGESKTKLFVGGNHGEESYLNLWFEDCRWTLSDEDDPDRECRPGDEPVLKFLREHGPQTAPHIASLILKTSASVRSSLARLSERRLVIKDGNKWEAVEKELFNE